MKSSLLFLCCALSFLSNGQVITKVAGYGYPGYFGDGGPAISAGLDPTMVCFDVAGNMYVTQNDNHVRKISTAGIISTIAGTGYNGYSGDYGPATLAQIFTPVGIVADATGNVFFADQSNQRVREVDIAGIITTYAGNGTGGFSGDYRAATTTELCMPAGMTYDGYGNMVVAEDCNSDVRSISPSGIITTIAGHRSYGYSGDGGPASAASMNGVTDVAYDAAGNLYVAEHTNHVIRKINTAGIVSTVVGNGFGHGTATGGYSGDGGPATRAELNYPLSVRVDGLGNIFIADRGNNVVRKVNAAGIISTFAGTGAYGYGTGDGGPATAAVISTPSCVALDGDGNVYVVDYGNGTIRKISVAMHLTSSAGDTVCSGSTVTFNAALSSAGYNIGYQWKRNGINVGTGGSSYVTSSLATGDVITCNLYNTITTDTIAKSDTVTMFTYSTPSAGTITGGNVVCQGAAITLADTAAGGVWSGSNAAATISSSGLLSGVAAGTANISYTVSTAHCSSKAVETVTVNSLPSVTAITATIADTACWGQTVNFSDSAPGGVWSLFDTALATISSGGTMNVLPAGEGPDTVYYTITNSCGMAIAAFPVQTINCEAGVREASEEPYGISVFPNPATSELFLKVSTERNEQVRITVTDVTGQVQKQYTIATNVESAIKPGLPPGVYCISAATSRGQLKAVATIMR